MKRLISYFLNNQLITNILFFGIIGLAINLWFHTNKEEMPEFASNWIRVMTYYPGASPEDVELLVTKAIEKELKAVVGLEEVVTTSSSGVSSIRIIIDDDYPDKKEVVEEIYEAALRAKLPSEVRDLPVLRQFKSSEKAILDVGLYLKDKRFLSGADRSYLQKKVLDFETQVQALSEVSSVSRSHYRDPELQIYLDPEEVKRNEISYSLILDQIRKNNLRVPLGELKNKKENRVSVVNELEQVEDLERLILQGNYEGKGVRLGDIANKIIDGHKESKSIFKINGYEAVFLNIKKNVSADILKTQKKVFNVIEKFKEINKGTNLQVIMMDDESFAVRNRLKMITMNGILGFALILLILYLFLDFKTGLWVGMGIPFSIAFTLVWASLFGYTVNNMTLAAIIIVLGIVVDDAIIIAENITRQREEKGESLAIVEEGTAQMVKPIVASILTTCLAFIPLLYFDGFFGKLVKYIPLIIILMLLGSLFESLFILPSHLAHPTPFLKKKKKQAKNWFQKWENVYRNILSKLLSQKFMVLGAAIIFLMASAVFYSQKMKFVMFPREEGQEVYIKINLPKKFTRVETAKAIEPLEDFIAKDENVVAVRSNIGLSRRGGRVNNNRASVLVELYPLTERSESLDQIIKRWKEFSQKHEAFEKIKFLRGRWGHGSGYELEILVQENNDEVRESVYKEIETYLSSLDSIKDVEVDAPLKRDEYIIKLNQENLIRFKVEPRKITNSLRVYFDGAILYTLNKGDEEVDVRLTTLNKFKKNLDGISDLRVENREGQLVPLKKLIGMSNIKKPLNIVRNDFKRSTMIFASMKKEAKKTPIEIAESLEKNLFNSIYQKYPSVVISFKGEVKNSRESQSEFLNSVLLVIIFIYLLLVFVFNSLLKPLIILTIIPFGLASVVWILLAHSMTIYGFFAVIGAFGMIGVVINDAIVMVDKFEKESISTLDDIVEIAGTRLRPVLLTTITTVVGLLPTAYGVAGHDSMLSEMMLTMGWGLVLGTLLTLILIPCLYSLGVRKN